MSGLIDTGSLGLMFGESLQYQREIGSSGLTEISDNLDPAGAMITEDGDAMLTEAGDAMVTETT